MSEEEECEEAGWIEMRACWRCGCKIEEDDYYTGFCGQCEYTAAKSIEKD